MQDLREMVLPFKICIVPLPCFLMTQAWSDAVAASLLPCLQFSVSLFLSLSLSFYLCLSLSLSLSLCLSVSHHLCLCLSICVSCLCVSPSLCRCLCLCAVASTQATCLSEEADVPKC